MSKFLYDKRVTVMAVTGAFIAQGLLAILQHHNVVGIALIFLALLPAIFVLLQIKMMHGSLFSRETNTFIVTIVIVALLTVALTPLVEMLFQ